jgi:hypothetical protein
MARIVVSLEFSSAAKAEPEQNSYRSAEALRHPKHKSENRN